MSTQELNFCIRHIFDRNMSPSYSRTVMHLAHLYSTDRDAYNKEVMRLANGSAVVIM